MDRRLSGLEPNDVFYYFEEISRIPRGSKNEQAISDYLVTFAKARGLEVKRDAALNVLINKPATPGYEDFPKIILQGHMDMVCVKAPGVEHDFTKDPIDLVIEGEFLRARGTSLGADNGNAVALCLAILDNDKISHPPLQILLTSMEETGMQGAKALDASILDGDLLIGLDYSQDSNVLVSCAGGSDNCFTIKSAKEAISNKDVKSALNIKISGLASGHSGNDIVLGRANANRVLGEILGRLENLTPIEIAVIEGGVTKNVIPAEAHTTICCMTKEVERLKQAVEELAEQLLFEYRETDPNMSVECVICETPACAYSQTDTNKIITLLNLIPNGLQNFLDAERLFTKSSANLGVICEVDDGVEIQSFVRSNSEYEHDCIIYRMGKIAELCDAEYRNDNRADVWEYDPDSSLASQVQDVWEKMRGSRPTINIIHAGVETGIFIGKMRQLGKKIKAVNLGVRNYDVHTPRERMEIASIGRTYNLLIELLATLR